MLKSWVVTPLSLLFAERLAQHFTDSDNDLNFILKNNKEAREEGVWPVFGSLVVIAFRSCMGSTDAWGQKLH